MQHEFDALRTNDTWSLVPRPNIENFIGSKWMYRTKYHANGSLNVYKVRLVARGFTQIPGIVFTHTFSLIVKAFTNRVVLSLAFINGWDLCQFDVNNAFLHDHLDKIVYMEQPPGFASPQFLDHVWRLYKAIYGLKQAPRAWFHCLFLFKHGFLCSKGDPSLFVFKRDQCIMYLFGVCR